MPERVNFGKLREVLEIPDLIGSQIDSYKNFLQMDTDPKQRKNQGLQAVFNEVFPMEGIDKQMVLEALIFSLFGVGVHLEKSFIRIDLTSNQIGYLKHFSQFSKINAFRHYSTLSLWLG